MEGRKKAPLWGAGIATEFPSVITVILELDTNPSSNSEAALGWHMTYANFPAADISGIVKLSGATHTFGMYDNNTDQEVGVQFSLYVPEWWADLWIEEWSLDDNNTANYYDLDGFFNFAGFYQNDILKCELDTLDETAHPDDYITLQINAGNWARIYMPNWSLTGADAGSVWETIVKAANPDHWTDDDLYFKMVFAPAPP